MSQGKQFQAETFVRRDWKSRLGSASAWEDFGLNLVHLKAMPRHTKKKETHTWLIHTKQLKLQKLQSNISLKKLKESWSSPYSATFSKERKCYLPYIWRCLELVLLVVVNCCGWSEVVLIDEQWAVSQEKQFQAETSVRRDWKSSRSFYVMWSEHIIWKSLWMVVR